jgi:hypothetical protein
MRKLLITGCLILTTACRAETRADSTPAAPIHTPTRPATTTPAFTSTPAFSPTPIPQFFREDFNTDLKPWMVLQTGGAAEPAMSLKNGLVRWDIASSHTWSYMIHQAHTYGDVLLGAKFSGTPSGSIGLVCRYSPAGWYEFNLASDGTYSVLFAQWLERGIAQYTPITHASSEYLRTGNLSYEIGLTCREEALLLHVNGKLFKKVDVTRYGLTEGRVGVSIASFEDTPMIASLDWFAVSRAGQ